MQQQSEFPLQRQSPLLVRHSRQPKANSYSLPKTTTDWKLRHQQMTQRSLCFVSMKLPRYRSALFVQTNFSPKWMPKNFHSPNNQK